MPLPTNTTDYYYYYYLRLLRLLHRYTSERRRLAAEYSARRPFFVGNDVGTVLSAVYAHLPVTAVLSHRVVSRSWALLLPLTGAAVCRRCQDQAGMCTDPSLTDMETVTEKDIINRPDMDLNSQVSTYFVSVGFVCLVLFVCFVCLSVLFVCLFCVFRARQTSVFCSWSPSPFSLLCVCLELNTTTTTANTYTATSFARRCATASTW